MTRQVAAEDMKSVANPSVKLPDPHPAQAEVLQAASRFNVVACGRRWGKTSMGLAQAAEAAMAGMPVGWLSPTYKMLLEVWREALHLLEPVTARHSKAEHRIELKDGGLLEMWSLDSPDVTRGRKYALIVVDEAAMVKDLQYAWENVLRPTLTDLQGKAWFLSTPKGRNYFWTLYNRGFDGGEWASWRMPTSRNPHIVASEIAAAATELPADVFSQEYLAEFTADVGAVFRNVRGAVEPALETVEPYAGRFVMGVDWAQARDWTVLTVMDVDTRQVVAIDRFNQISWQVQRDRLRALADRWQVRSIVAESNSIGGPNIEALQAEGLPVRAFLTTNESKTQAVQALALAFERGAIAIPDNAALIAELESFAATRLPSGRWQYAAAAGMHDDMVVSLMLVYGATLNSGSPLALVEWG